MANKSLADLRKMPRAQLKAINKDELIDCIMSANDREMGVLTRLEEKLAVIANELSEFRRTFSTLEATVDKKLAEMQCKIDQQAEVITKQQLFLENIDRKERETNLVVLGVPDEQESMDGARNDSDKLEKIWTVIGEDTEVRSYRRLGRPTQGNNRSRPILVVVRSKSDRDKILEKARRLKDSGTPYNKIYVKKDVHPAVRQEWKRLRNVEAAERERPENQGCIIHLDTRERKLYRDGVMIDKWNPHPF